VEFKPQFKKQGEDGKEDGSEKEEAGIAERDEKEVKEAASF
jgi:hypothetical protein